MSRYEKQFSGDFITGLFTAKEGLKIVQRSKAHGITGLESRAADVWQHEDVIIGRQL